MIRSGFEYSDSNDIPIFRYPDSLLAKKIGITKQNYIYHLTIIEEQPYIDEEMNEPETASDYKKPIRISLSCAENSHELRSIYEKYLKLPHYYTNETTIVYRGRYDNLTCISLVALSTKVELNYLISETINSHSYQKRQLYYVHRTRKTQNRQRLSMLFAR